MPQGSYCVEISKTNKVKICCVVVRSEVKLDTTVDATYIQAELDLKRVFALLTHFEPSDLKPHTSSFDISR